MALCFHLVDGTSGVFLHPGGLHPGSPERDNLIGASSWESFPLEVQRHTCLKCLETLKSWPHGNAEQLTEALWSNEKSDKHLVADAVAHPAHYNHGKIEVIEFLEDQQLGPHEWNAVKYVCRARHKGNEIQDLEKAIWYLRRKIELLNSSICGSTPLRPNEMPK